MEAFTEPIITERLILSRLTWDDWKSLASLLQDPSVMYAYEHAFSQREVTAWLERQLERYEEDGGLGLLKVCRKEDGVFIGQCGLTSQLIGTHKVSEIGYLLKKEYWHCGYASEAALAVRDYAFNVLHLDEVYSIIRENNFASQNVAIRIGMEPVDEIIKHYWGMDMKHICYCIRRPGTA